MSMSSKILREVTSSMLLKEFGTQVPNYQLAPEKIVLSGDLGERLVSSGTNYYSPGVATVYHSFLFTTSKGWVRVSGHLGCKNVIFTLYPDAVLTLSLSIEEENVSSSPTIQSLGNSNDYWKRSTAKDSLRWEEWLMS